MRFTNTCQRHRLETIGTLAGGVGHDFDNVLQAICSLVELTSWSIEPASEAHKHLDQISGAVKRAAQIVNQILTFSRGQADERVVPALVELQIFPGFDHVIGQRCDELQFSPRRIRNPNRAGVEMHLAGDGVVAFEESPGAAIFPVSQDRRSDFGAMHP